MSPRIWQDGAWRKSTRSGANGNCVEVTALDGVTVGMRDSKDPDGPVLTVPAAAWTAFIAARKTSH